MTRRADAWAAADRGSGTVLTMGLVAVALVLIVAISLLGRAQSARGAAQAAADLGALAAAQHLAGWRADVLGSGVAPDRGLTASEGPRTGDSTPGDGSMPVADLVDPVDGGTACAIARDVVAANGATLTGCVLLGDGVVRVTTARVAGVNTARATARAGPRHSRDAPGRGIDPRERP